MISISVHASYATSESRASLGLTHDDEVIAGGRAGDGETYHYTTTSSSPIALGQWYYLVGVTEYSRFNGRIRIYIDGDLEHSLNINFTQNTSSNTTATNSAIGTQDNASEDFFWGIIDEVRVWQVARTTEEIAASYNRILAPDTPGLVGYWNFDEPAGQHVYDQTSYGNHGTLGMTDTVGIDDPLRVDSDAPLVPEPATLALLAMGGLTLLRGRGRSGRRTVVRRRRPSASR